MKRWLASRRRVLVVATLVAVALAPGLLRLETDNSPEIFFVDGSPKVATYRDFVATFGSDRALRVALSGDLWGADALAFLGRVESAARELPGVASATGLATLWRGTWPPADPGAFAAAVTQRPLARAGGWVAADGSVATILVVLTGDAERDDVLAGLRSLVASPPAGVDADLVGLPVLNEALDASSREIERRYFPLLVAFAAALLLLCVRSGRGLVAPLVFVGFCELVTLATMGYAGIALNLVLAVLPPLLFVIALATALHLQLRFRALRVADPDRGAIGACLDTYREKGWSVLWTGVTTVIGFASLTVSPVAPVRSLGLWAAFGLGSMTLLAFVLYPALLVVTDRGAVECLAPFERRVSALGRRWGRVADRRRRLVLILTGALALVAAGGLPRLIVETNALAYLGAEHPARAGIEALESRGIGVASAEVWVRGPRFENAAEIAPLAALGRRLAAEPLVYGALDAGALLADGTSFLVSPDMALAALRGDAAGRHALEALVSADGARLTLFVPTVGRQRLAPVVEFARAATRRAFPDAEVVVTGQLPLLLAAQRYLISTLALSLALTVGAVAIVLRLMLPSTRLTVLALLPNLWPVLGVLGLMGWAAIPIDIATVMVASIVLGLAVDDTVHTLGHFRLLAPRHGAREGVVRTLEITAPAYLLTGVVLIAGFGVCALSDFAPTARFGLLSAVAIVLAVLGDLFLLPALLSLCPKKAVKRLARRHPGSSPEPDSRQEL